MTAHESLFSFVRRQFVWPVCNSVLYLIERRWRDKSCRCGWCVECLGWGPY